MDYSNSFIPKIPSRYTLDKATMTESLIELQPGGSVSIRLSAEDTQTAPENMRLTIMADKYTDAYNPEAFVDIQITNTNISYRFLNPIVDTSNGFYITELALDSKEDYTDFVFTIRSAYAMKILSWELAGPASTSEEYIEEMRKELPRLLKDYNEMPYLVGQAETTVCLISAFLVKNTDLNGHLQVSYRATEDCQVIMRAKDNDVTELFSPVVIDIKAGRGSLDIPHAYVEKFIGYHTFTCTLQVTNGMLKIPTRAVLYTVDGGHLAERVMDVGMDVRDIAMARRVQDKEPSYIYAIGVDDDVVAVRARPYNEVANTAWEPRLSVGGGKTAAIEFDGDWDRSTAAWRFITHEVPWVIWTDLNNTLYARLWDSENTKSQLATNVVQVKALRGWKTLEAENKDQGIVVAYVKTDGKAYYRRYVQRLDLTYYWTSEETLTQFTDEVVSIDLFLANDYRLGITVTLITGITHWLLTPRNYSALSTGPAGVIAMDYSDISLQVIPTEIVTKENKGPSETVEILDFASRQAFYINEGPPLPVKPVRLQATNGYVVNNRRFVVEFNYPVSFWTTLNRLSMVQDLGLTEVTADGHTVTFETDRDLDTKGFMIRIGGGTLVAATTNNFSEVYQGNDLWIRGTDEPILETIRLDYCNITASFVLTEAQVYEQPVFEKDTIRLDYIEDSIIFDITIIEVGVQPI